MCININNTKLFIKLVRQCSQRLKENDTETFNTIHREIAQWGSNESNDEKIMNIS